MTAVTVVADADKAYKERLANWLRKEISERYSGGQGRGQNAFASDTSLVMAEWGDPKMKGFRSGMLQRWIVGDYTRMIEGKVLTQIGILRGYVKLPPKRERTPERLEELKVIAQDMARDWLRGRLTEEEVAERKRQTTVKSQGTVLSLPDSEAGDLIATLEAMNLSASQLRQLAHWAIDKMPATQVENSSPTLTPKNMPDNRLTFYMKGLCQDHGGVSGLAKEVSGIGEERIQEIVDGSQISIEEAETLRQPLGGIDVAAIAKWGVIYDYSIN